MDYELMRLSVDNILSQSNKIGIELKKKFDVRQKSYEDEIEELKPTQRQMIRPMNF